MFHQNISVLNDLATILLKVCADPPPRLNRYIKDLHTGTLSVYKVEASQSVCAAVWDRSIGWLDLIRIVLNSLINFRFAKIWLVANKKKLNKKKCRIHHRCKYYSSSSSASFLVISVSREHHHQLSSATAHHCRPPSTIIHRRTSPHIIIRHRLQSFVVRHLGISLSSAVFRSSSVSVEDRHRVEVHQPSPSVSNVNVFIHQPCLLGW